MDAYNNIKRYPSGGTAKRATLGGVMNVVSSFIKAIENMVFVPLFLYFWGTELYGEWLVLFSIVGYLSISSLGMGNYVVNRMTQAYSKGDIKEYVKIFKSALGIYTVISLILLIFLTLFSLTAPLEGWFNITIASDASIRLTVLILGSYIIASTLFGFFDALYITTGEFFRSKTLTNIKDILVICFVALTLYFRGSFVSIASVYLISLFIFMMFFIFDSLRRHKEIQMSLAKIDWKLAVSFILPGLVFLLIPISSMIYLQGSILIISANLGAGAVAVFGVHRTLASLIQRFTSIVDPAIKPELTASEARGEYSKIRLIYHFFTKVILYSSITLSIILFFLGQDLMELWTNGKIDFNSNLWAVFLILIPVVAFGNFSASFQEATNRYTKLAISRIIAASTGLFLALNFAKSLGLVGVLLGFLLSELVINFWYIPYNTIKIIKDRKEIFIVSMLGVIPLVLGQFFIGSILNDYIVNIWARIISISLTISVVGFIYLYLFWFNKTEKLTANNFIFKVRRFLFKK